MKMVKKWVATNEYILELKYPSFEKKNQFDERKGEWIKGIENFFSKRCWEGPGEKWKFELKFFRKRKYTITCNTSLMTKLMTLDALGWKFQQIVFDDVFTTKAVSTKIKF